MPNLYGSSPEADIDDYQRLFADPDIRPDELKIYPCSLIESAELMQVYQAGLWRPYTHDELLRVLMACFQHTPEYCRLTRVIRDIPGTDIVAGDMMTNFRQVVEQELKQRGLTQPEYPRARSPGADDLHWMRCTWTNCGTQPGSGMRCFCSISPTIGRSPGFCGCRCPTEPADHGRTGRRGHDPRGACLRAGARPWAKNRRARRSTAGLGTQLIERAAEIAAERGYARLAVISSVGTREYYRKRGFADGAALPVSCIWRARVMIQVVMVLNADGGFKWLSDEGKSASVNEDR